MATILNGVRAFLRYTAARLVLFGLALGVLYLIGARSWLLFLLALLLSGLVSYVLLSRQRDAIAAVVTERLRRLRREVDVGAASEDALDEQRRREAR